jgi:integrase
MNDILLNTKKLNSYLGNDDNDNEDDNGDKPYTREQIARLIEYADIRTKVMVLLMSSTGMRVGALPILKFGHLTLV